jgi:hypothetical protein
MTNVHLFFLKLFGCIISEALANGHEVPIDIKSFSKAIMAGRPHPEVHLAELRSEMLALKSVNPCHSSSTDRHVRSDLVGFKMRQATSEVLTGTVKTKCLQRLQCDLEMVRARSRAQV